MIRDLVARPSISSADPDLDQSNRGVIDTLAGWAEGIGLGVECHRVPALDDKWNLIATAGPRDTGAPAGLVLAGHTDTVPYDEGRWTSGPFDAVVRDGRLYGLGTADMKGFVALALAAIARFDPDALRAPVVLLGTADEESGMDGARALVAEGRAIGRRAVIGEPTGRVPIRMHKGIMIEAIDVVGRSGHSSNPDLGRSALDGMYRVLGALLALRDDWMRRYREPAFEVPTPTVNFGQIRGGDAPNRICAQCRLTYDVRMLPGMEPDELRAEVRRRVRDVLAGTELDVVFHSLFPAIPPFVIDADAELVRTLEAVDRRPAGCVAFGTEAPFFAELGMETVVYGPGSIDVAHQPDEYLPLDEIEPTIDVLAGLIRRYCVEPGGPA